MTMTVTHCAKRSSGHAAAPRAGRVSTWECVWAPRCQPMIMAGSGGGALRCRPGGLEEGLKTRFECDDRLMDTTQTGRERSRNISRSLQAFPHSTELCGGGCHRSAKASRGEDLEVQEPVARRYASAFHFHPTLASVLGPSLIRHEVV